MIVIISEYNEPTNTTTEKTFSQVESYLYSITPGENYEIKLKMKNENINIDMEMESSVKTFTDSGVEIGGF